MIISSGYVFLFLIAFILPLLYFNEIFEDFGINGFPNFILSWIGSLLIVGCVNFFTYEDRMEKQEKYRALNDVTYYVKEYKIKEHHDEHKQCFNEYKQSNQTLMDFDIFSCVQRKVMAKTEKEQVEKEKESLKELKQ